MRTKKFIMANFLLALVISFVSCSDNDEPSRSNVDGGRVPTEFIIYIDGDENMNIRNVAFGINDITIAYKGKVYRMNEENSTQEGISLGCKQLDNGGYVVNFGKFPGEYTKETFVIDYGNGTTDNVSFSSSGMFEPKGKYTLWINDVLKVEQYAPQFYLTIKNSQLEVMTAAI